MASGQPQPLADDDIELRRIVPDEYEAELTRTHAPVAFKGLRRDRLTSDFLLPRAVPLQQLIPAEDQRVGDSDTYADQTVPSRPVRTGTPPFSSVQCWWSRGVVQR